ncbi:hypothetical protein B566_EDAN007319 [Ephemera danica]|nr:hypothetical protein B566_EDAN007319 [Ephemera danica]
MSNQKRKGISSLGPRQKIRRMNEILDNEFSVSQDDDEGEMSQDPSSPTTIISSDENESSDVFYESDAHDRHSDSEHFSSAATLSPNCSEDSAENETTFKDKLRHWVTSRNISEVDTETLLNDVLRTHQCHKDLPKTRRSLLNTKRGKVDVVDMQPNGKFYYFGIEDGITEMLKSAANTNDINNVRIMLGIDGMPISKNGVESFWVILGRISSIPNSEVFVIAVFSGEGKPADSNEFLRNTVDELCDLTENGFVFNEKHVTFRLEAIVADAPAKSFLLKCKSHNGYSSCTKCDIEGEYGDNRTYFEEVNCRLRTDASFRAKADEAFHEGRSILEEIPQFDMIKNVVLDYMHVLLEGVVKKFLRYLLKNSFLHKNVSRAVYQQISDTLQSLSEHIPVECARKPRSLKHFEKFKATEFRQILLYTSPVILHHLIADGKKEYYDTFMELHVASTILCSEKSGDAEILYAKELFIHFIQSFKVLFRRTLLSHNVHSLTHLADEVLMLGHLDRFSAFPFENYLQKIKKHLKNSGKMLQQLVLRLDEKKKNVLRKPAIPVGAMIHLNQHNSGPLFPGCVDPQFKKIQFTNFVLRADHTADSCCVLKSNAVVLIENFASSNTGELRIIGRQFDDRSNVYSTPIESSALGILKVKRLGALMSWPITEIQNKCVKLPHEDCFVIVPFLHCS